MYIETSSPRQPGDSATLNAPQLPFSGQTCVTFFYHMYGAAIGNLSVRLNGREVFSASGNKGNVWLKASLSLNLNRGYTVRNIYGRVKTSCFEARLKLLHCIMSAPD